MKMLFIYALSSLTLLSGLAVAQNCPKNAADPFAIETSMTEGPFKGHCVDTNRYRSARRLTRQERQEFFTPDEKTKMASQGTNIDDPHVEIIANFAASDAAKKEHFFVAVIPTERILRAVMQLTQLSKELPIYHGQVRLGLSKAGRPIFLIDQSRESHREMKILNDDVVVTISGVRPIDHEQSYNAFKGLLPGYYGEEFQIGSEENLTFNWIRSEKLTTKEYLLNVSTEQARLALTKGIDISTQGGLEVPYSTLTSSCLNLAFLIFHDILGTPDSAWRKPFQSIRPQFALKFLGLINWDGSSWLQDLH